MSIAQANAFPEGMTFELHPSGDYVSDVIRSTGDFFERPILDEIARRVRGGVIVDVGSHIGNHTVFMAAFVPHSAIHAFEPLPANLELLRRNVAPYPSVFVHGVALSGSLDQVDLRMTVEPDNLGHARITHDGEIGVRAISLDSYRFRDVSLIKIDVEGWEPQVLAGARRTIARWHPLIVVEDWSGKLEPPAGYRRVAEWEQAHQTFMFAWAP